MRHFPKFLATVTFNKNGKEYIYYSKLYLKEGKYVLENGTTCYVIKCEEVQNNLSMKMRIVTLNKSFQMRNLDVEHYIEEDYDIKKNNKELINKLADCIGHCRYDLAMKALEDFNSNIEKHLKKIKED